MSKLNSNDIAEIGRYFNPNGQIVTSLPNAKSVRDFSEVAIQNKDGNTFDTYKMIKGNWIKTGSNVNNITNIIQGGSGGSGTAGIESISATSPILSSGGSNPNISHNDSGVIAGTYNNANTTVDAKGHITAIADGFANIDGGSASSIYLSSQNIDGGSA